MRVANVLLSKAKANTGCHWYFEEIVDHEMKYKKIMYLVALLVKKVVMVLLRSTVSNHCITSFRERTADKKEIIFFDPLIEMDCVYKEVKKIRGMKWPLKISKQYNEDTYGIITQELLDKVAKETFQKESEAPKNKAK